MDGRTNGPTDRRTDALTASSLLGRSIIIMKHQNLTPTSRCCQLDIGYGVRRIRCKRHSYASACLTVTFDPINLIGTFGCSAISDTFSAISVNLQFSEVTSGLLHKFIKKCRFTSDILVIFAAICSNFWPLMEIWDDLWYI